MQNNYKSKYHGENKDRKYHNKMKRKEKILKQCYKNTKMRNQCM